MKLSSFLFITTTALILWTGFLVYKDTNDPSKRSVTNVNYDLQESIPSSILFKNNEEGYHFGRWKFPPKDITFQEELVYSPANVWKNNLMTKKWVYLTLSNPKYFIAFAVVQLHYVGLAFVYVVEKENPTVQYHYQHKVPLGFGVKMAPSPVEGCTNYSSSFMHSDHPEISICYAPIDVYRIELNINLTPNDNSFQSKRLIGSFAVNIHETLSFSFPLDNNKYRPAFVVKNSGMFVNGQMKFGEESEYFEGLAALDWTKSLAMRETMWNWVSFSNTLQVSYLQKGSTTPEISKSSVGINLSTRVYDMNGDSIENALWINGTVYILPGVEFSVPKEPLKENWRVSLRNKNSEEKIDLVFTPYGSTEEHTNAKIVVNEFVQPYGVYNGIIKLIKDSAVIEIQVVDTFGVIEDHHAIW